MMNFLSRLHKQTVYVSLAWHDSACFPGVRFAVRKSSLARRLELAKRTRDLTLQYEFLKAGDTTDQLEATLADLLARKLYFEWGLHDLTGLQVDGVAATKDSLIEKGPESLVEEVLAAIRAETELSEDERKNS